MSDKMEEPNASNTATGIGPETDIVNEAAVENADQSDTVEPASDDENVEPSLDIIFEILRNQRRQLVLEFLREQDGTITIGELAEHIAAIENDTTVRQLNAQQRKRVYIGLYQCHLPKMDDVDVVEFNQSRGRISPGEHIEPLYEYLDVANDESDEEEDTDPTHKRIYSAGYLAFSSAFFVAQLSGAYMVASLCVLLILGAAVLATH